MDKKLSGTLSLPDQESAIRLTEATGFELTDLRPDPPAPPDQPSNNVTFKELPLGELPKEIHLLILTPTVIAEQKAQGRTLVWQGRIFVSGNLQNVGAFR